jgi:hypothetical protein
MAEEHKSDDVEKLLAEQKTLENRKQALIADLLKQKEALIKDRRRIGSQNWVTKRTVRANGNAATTRKLHHRQLTRLGRKKQDVRKKLPSVMSQKYVE